MNNNNFTVYRCVTCEQIQIVPVGENYQRECCGTIIAMLHENTIDASTEKHVPVITRTDDGVTVSVGEIFHPMEDAHYIEMIAIITDAGVVRQVLTPSDSPEAHFSTNATNITAIAYCNLHGLWQASLEI